jgi:hypothetical protein
MEVSECVDTDWYWMGGSEGKDIMVSFVATFPTDFSKAGSLRFA